MQLQEFPVLERGGAPRLNRNSLAFLAIDRTRLQDLDEAVRRYLANRPAHQFTNLPISQSTNPPIPIVNRKWRTP